MERYFAKLPKGTHLVPVLRPPSPKRPKRGPGRPRKVQLPPVYYGSNSSVSSDHGMSSSDEASHRDLATEGGVRSMKRDLKCDAKLELGSTRVAM